MDEKLGTRQGRRKGGRAAANELARRQIIATASEIEGRGGILPSVGKREITQRHHEFLSLDIFQVREGAGRLHKCIALRW